MALKERAPSGFLEVTAAAEARLRRGPLPPLLVLAGEEPFLKERLIEAAVATVAADGGACEVFAARAGESDAAAGLRLLDAWRTPTLFGGGSLILARGADRLLAGPRLAACEALLDGPEPPHRLLLTVDALDGRSRLAKRLKQSGALVALPPLRDSPPPWQSGPPTLETELNQWIVAEARAAGLRVELPAADELAQRIGNEPAALARRLQQLAVLLGAGHALAVDEVRAHVPRSSARLLVLYEDALRAGDVARALERLDQMLLLGVYDHTGRLVAGDLVADTVLRRLTGNLARVLEAHEALTPELRRALASKPWQRSEEDTAALAAVFAGGGGARVFLERDVRATRPDGVRAAFALALAGLRALRDGRGLSLHALTVRLCRAFAPAAAGGPATRAASAATSDTPSGAGPASRRGGGARRWA